MIFYLDLRRRDLEISYITIDELKTKKNIVLFHKGITSLFNDRETMNLFCEHYVPADPNDRRVYIIIHDSVDSELGAIVFEETEVIKGGPKLKGPETYNGPRKSRIIWKGKRH